MIEIFTAQYEAAIQIRTNDRMEQKKKIKLKWQNIDLSKNQSLMRTTMAIFRNQVKKRERKKSCVYAELRWV